VSFFLFFFSDLNRQKKYDLKKYENTGFKNRLYFAEPQCQVRTANAAHVAAVKENWVQGRDALRLGACQLPKLFTGSYDYDLEVVPQRADTDLGGRRRLYGGF
jgi:hypothetical protein